MAKKKSYNPFLIDRQRKQISYRLKPDCYQYRHIETISIDGFENPPKGFRKDGQGIARPALFVLGDIARKFGRKIALRLRNRGKPGLRKVKSLIRATFDYHDFFTVLDELKEIKTTGNKDCKKIADAYLHTTFPRYFKKTEYKYKGNYQKDALARSLRRKNVLSNLSSNDIDALADFYPRFLSAHNKKIARKKRLFISKQSKNATEAVYLDLAPIN